MNEMPNQPDSFAARFLCNAGELQIMANPVDSTKLNELAAAAPVEDEVGARSKFVQLAQLLNDPARQGSGTRPWEKTDQFPLQPYVSRRQASPETPAPATAPATLDASQQAFPEPKRNQPAGSATYLDYLRAFADKTKAGDPCTQETPLPAQYRVVEAEPKIVPAVTKWQLISDCSLYNPRPELGNRNLKPIGDNNPNTPSARPGHFYTFGFGADNLPRTALEYYTDSKGAPKYYQQYQMKYYDQKDGGLVVDISQYRDAGQGNASGIREAINTVPHTKIGFTRYFLGLSDKGSHYVKQIQQFPGSDTANPSLQIDMSQNGVYVQQRRPDGTLKADPIYQGPAAQQQLKELSRRIYFYNLFGPAPVRYQEVPTNPQLE